MYEYEAFVDRVVDGDTFEATVDLGFGVSVKTTFRLKDVDTPETFRPRNEAEREHGVVAKLFVMRFMLHTKVLIKSSKTGKYGRWLAVVHNQEGENLADLLRANDLVKRDNYDEVPHS